MRLLPKSIAVGVAAGMVAAMTVTAAAAQMRVGAKQDWSIFEAGEGAEKVCWIATKPKRWKAERDGETVQVQRGDIYLMVSVRPADDVRNEVSFLSGYPFEEGSTVTVKVAGEDFTMFTDGQNAWAPSKAADDRMTEAFRAGLDVKAIGLSSRGTTTYDTFSLMGFTAALSAAQDRCS